MCRGCDLVNSLGFWSRLTQKHPRCCDTIFSHRCELSIITKELDNLALEFGLGFGGYGESMYEQANQLKDWADVVKEGPMMLAVMCDEDESPLDLLHEDVLPLLCALRLDSSQPNGSIDVHAYMYLQDLLLSCAQEHGSLVLPVAVRGNGNCLLNALSWAIWGMETHAVRLRQAFIDEVQAHVDWYKQAEVFGGEYDNIMSELQHYDPYLDANASLSPQVLTVAANVLERPVVLCASLEKMRELGCAQDLFFGTYVPSRLIAEGKPLRTKTPVALAWSGEPYVHFVPLVACEGFADMQLPIFLAEDGKAGGLCASAKDMEHVSWKSPAIRQLDVSWYQPFVSDLAQVIQELRSYDMLYPRGLPPEAVATVAARLLLTPGSQVSPADNLGVPASSDESESLRLVDVLRPTEMLASVAEYKEWQGALVRVEKMMELRRRSEFEEWEVTIDKKRRDQLLLPGSADPANAAFRALEAMGWTERPSRRAAGSACHALFPTVIFGEHADAMLELFIERLSELAEGRQASKKPPPTEACAKAVASFDGIVAATGAKLEASEQEQRKRALEKTAKLAKDWLQCLRDQGWGILQLDDALRKRLRLPGVRKPDAVVLEFLQGCGWGLRGTELYAKPTAWKDPEATFLELIAALAKLRQEAVVQLPGRVPGLMRSFRRAGGPDGRPESWDMIVNIAVYYAGVKVKVLSMQYDSSDAKWFQREAQRIVMEHLRPGDEATMESQLRKQVESRVSAMAAIARRHCEGRPKKAAETPAPAAEAAQSEEDEELMAQALELSIQLNAETLPVVSLSRAASVASATSVATEQPPPLPLSRGASATSAASARVDVAEGVPAPLGTVRRARSDEPVHQLALPEPLRRAKTATDPTISRRFESFNRRLDRLRLQPQAASPLGEGVPVASFMPPEAMRDSDSDLPGPPKAAWGALPPVCEHGAPADTSEAAEEEEQKPQKPHTYQIKGMGLPTVAVEAEPAENIGDFVAKVTAKISSSCAGTVSSLQLVYRDAQQNITLKLNDMDQSMCICPVVPNRSQLHAIGDVDAGPSPEPADSAVPDTAAVSEPPDRGAAFGTMMSALAEKVPPESREKFWASVAAHAVRTARGYSKEDLLPPGFQSLSQKQLKACLEKVASKRLAEVRHVYESIPGRQVQTAEWLDSQSVAIKKDIIREAWDEAYGYTHVETCIENISRLWGLAPTEEMSQSMSGDAAMVGLLQELLRQRGRSRPAAWDEPDHF